MIVLAALSIVGGLLLMAGGGLLGSVANNPEVVGDITATINSEGVTVTQEQAGIVVAGVGILGGAMSILGGILMLIVGILGVRGANDPRKIGPFRVFAIIGLVFSILGILALLFQPPDPRVYHRPAVLKGACGSLRRLRTRRIGTSPAIFFAAYSSY